MNDFETGVAVGYLLHKDSGSSIILDTFSTVANGHWTPQAGHAWNDITVNVPTYEQEYRKMQEECEKVKNAIKPYDPTLPDPWTPETDPTQPQIPDEIEKIAGYEPTNGDRDDIVQAITPLGGGTIDTVANGTVGNYDYTITFAGWSDGGQTGTQITGEPINDLWDMALYEDFTEGQFAYSAGGAAYIYPVWKITVNGISGKTYGYVAGIGYLNSSYYGYAWDGYCTEEWKFGISTWNSVTPSGSGYSVNANLYVDDGGWTTQDFVTKAGVTLTNGTITNKIY